MSAGTMHFSVLLGERGVLVCSQPSRDQCTQYRTINVHVELHCSPAKSGLSVWFCSLPLRVSCSSRCSAVICRDDVWVPLPEVHAGCN